MIVKIHTRVEVFRGDARPFFTAPDRLGKSIGFPLHRAKRYKQRMTMTPLDPRLDESPYALQKHLGFHLTHWGADHARLELPIEHYLTNRASLPHGGVYATLLDTVMGYAGCYTGDPDHKRLALTLSLTTNFLSRPKGRLLIAEGRKVGGGASSFFGEATVLDETGEVIARGSGAFKYRKTTL